MVRRVDITAYRMMNIGDILQRAKSRNEGALERAQNKSFGLSLRDQSLILFRLFLHFLEVVNPR